MVTVSYLILGGYAAFVVISSLLVGILPPLVNLPTCDPDSKDFVIKPSNRNIEVNNVVNEPIQNPLPNDNQKHSKISKRDTSKNVLERTSSFKESHPAFLSKLSTGNYPNLTICSEIINPVPGVRYPWYESKLPSYITPINYDIELFVPTWSSPVYDGEIDITFSVANSTNFVLLHSKLDLPFIDGILVFFLKLFDFKNILPIFLNCFKRSYRQKWQPR